MKNPVSVRWRKIMGIACGLLLAGTAVHAQNAEETKTEKFTVGFGAGVAGPGFHFTIRLDDVGEKLVAQLDTDKDGGASYVEFKAALQSHFQKWDADQSGTLSTNELAAGLKSVFPEPKVFIAQEAGAEAAPAGPPVKVIKRVAPDGGTVVRRVKGDAADFPEPPVLIANRVMAAADTDKNKEITAAEWEAVGIQWFRAWDFNENNLLSADDLTEGFHSLSGPPDGQDVILFLPE